MAHNYAINDDVHHQLQGPQGRAVTKQRSVYTVVSRLPIEADGRPRYRIKSKTENIERVVTEEQISRLVLSSVFLPLARSSGTSAVSNALDHDDFGSNRSKIMNVIYSNILERDAGG